MALANDRPVTDLNPFPMKLTLGVDFLLRVGIGLEPGFERVQGFGVCEDVDNSTLPEDVWTLGGLYPWMATASPLEVVSTSILDTALGLGARTIVVRGLNADYAKIEEVVVLNGTVPVALTKAFLRINSAAVLSAGTSKINTGVINIRSAGGGTVRAVVPAGIGVTRQSIYTVPAGHTMTIISIYAAIVSGAAVEKASFSAYIQDPLGAFTMPVELALSSAAPYRHEAMPGITFPEKTDICWRVTAVSSDSVSCIGSWTGLLVDPRVLR